jgi:hypothetical protein
MFPCLVIANRPRLVAAGLAAGREGPVTRMRSTNRWVGCPAVARPGACGLALIETHDAATAAITGIDVRSSVALKPFPARPFEESSP